MSSSRINRTAESPLDRLSRLLDEERHRTAMLLASLGEFEARKLYLARGYGTMLDYCVRELGLDVDEAAIRIRVARAACEFPAIFDAIAEGRLDLERAELLAPYLSPATADRLISEASFKSQAEIMDRVRELDRGPEERSEP